MIVVRKAKVIHTHEDADADDAETLQSSQLAKNTSSRHQIRIEQGNQRFSSLRIDTTPKNTCERYCLDLTP